MQIRLVFYLILGVLLFNFFIVYSLFLKPVSTFKQNEKQLIHLLAAKPTQWGKTAEGNRSPDFVYQSEAPPFSDLST